LNCMTKCSSWLWQKTILHSYYLPVYMLLADYKYCIFLTSRGALGMNDMLRVVLLLFYGMGDMMLYCTHCTLNKSYTDFAKSNASVS
jgi:hypothetical protein